MGPRFTEAKGAGIDGSRHGSMDGWMDGWISGWGWGGVTWTCELGLALHKLSSFRDGSMAQYNLHIMAWRWAWSSVCLCILCTLGSKSCRNPLFLQEIPELPFRVTSRPESDCGVPFLSDPAIVAPIRAPLTELEGASVRQAKLKTGASSSLHCCCFRSE